MDGWGRGLVVSSPSARGGMMLKALLWRWHSWRAKRAGVALFVHTNVLVSLKGEGGDVDEIILTRKEVT